VSVDQTVFDPGPSEWTPVGASGEDLAENAPRSVQVGDTPVFLVRSGGAVRALHDRCSHRGCSLAGGDVDGDVVECPCHGSRFALDDGRVLRGPATTPQPAYEVRDGAGGLEIRLRG
jgi:nitrite reductase/ring-hydroxylating ferredoxin subunit